MARDLTRSPFPGMDPYLEQYWGDVHHRLCTYACDLLRPSLPSGLIPRMDERTVIEDESDLRRTIIPDIRVAEYTKGNGGGGTAVAPALGEPMIIESENESVTEGFVQLIDARNGNRVITVIEFASQANKSSPHGRRMYRKKQFELLDGGVSLVEVDLIRAGEWNLLASMQKVKSRGMGVYHVCVTGADQQSRHEVYAIKLQDRLPVIRIPLRERDPDAALDLQILMNQVYENGSYGYDVDYATAPVQPLTQPDDAWAKGLTSINA